MAERDQAMSGNIERRRQIRVDRTRPERVGFAVQSHLQAGSVMGTVSNTTRAVVAAIPPSLLSFEA